MTRSLTSLTLALALALTAAARLEAQAPASADIATAPVEVDGAVLFNVRGVSSYPAAERARVIRDRIVEAAADHSVAIDSLRLDSRPNAIVIMAGDRAILPVVEADANLEDVTTAELAQAHLIRVREAIAGYRAARTARALRQSAVRTIVATVLLLVAMGVLVWVGRRLDALLERRLQAHVHTVGIQSFELMRGERIWAAIRGIVGGLRTLVLLALALIYAGTVLAAWPWTRRLSTDVASFALAPVEVIGGGIVENLPSLIFLAVLFVLTRVALKLIRLFFEAVERGGVRLEGFDPDWAQPTYKIVRVAVVAFGLVVAYPYIPGSQSAAFKGVSLFIGIVFSLGSSSAVSNIIAGYMMTYRRAFKVGDRVKIGQAVGDVIEMRLQVTHVRSLKNEEIVIPNSQILAGEVLNYSSLAASHGLILHTEVGIGYETPWRQVEAMLLAAAARTPGLSETPPFVRLMGLGDFAVTYELNVHCANVREMYQLYTLLHRNILDVFNEYGVQIMTPAYENDPAEPKIVPPAQWYAAPAASGQSVLAGSGSDR
jgi:small-conductance mechanosensitive channel